MKLLSVEDLHTHFVSRSLDNEVRVARALNGVGFSLERGRILGLVGETGAGKSLTALSIMGLLRPPARIVAGRIDFEGQDLVSLPPERLNALRGDRLALIVQNPRASLDPLARIGDQLARAHRAHRKVDAAAAQRRAVEMLAAVGLPDPERRARAWPHELSGGMAQRVLIAMALINEPKLVIADEPTTGLDVTVQAQILDLIQGMVRARGLGAIVITHDLGVVAHYCDDVAVMYAGGIVEQGATRDVLSRPRHPYTINLVDSTPERLVIGSGRVFGGAPPNLFALPEGVPAEIETTVAAMRADGRTAVVVSADGAALGVVAVADAVLPDARAAVGRLRQLGVAVSMASGDDPSVARRIAHEVGIDEVHAGVMPQGKAQIVEGIRSRGRCVAMVGDGVNDAPALAVADVGIAVGGGADIAADAADVVLMRPGVSGVADAIELARAAMRVVRQNLWWAFGYNIVGIPLAAGVLVPFTGWMPGPMLAAVAMSVSSVAVVGNSLRLRAMGRASPGRA